MKKIINSIIIIFIALFFVACKVEAFSIKFVQSEITATLNEELDLKFNSNIEYPAEIKYSFDNPEMIEQINNTFKAIKVGKVIIKAYWEKDNKIFDTIVVTIVDIDRSISFENNSLKLYKDETTDLNLNLLNLTMDDLGYRLSNQNIISITNDWKIQAKTVGSVTLTVFYLYNDSIYVNIPITVDLKQSITFTKDSISINHNENSTLPINLVGIELNQVVFSLSKLDIIKIENNIIIPLKPGTVTLRASLNTNTTINDAIDIIVKNYTINDYQYWIENLSNKYNPNDVILTKQEINSYNNTVFSNLSATKVVDLFNQQKTISKASLESMINTYSNINSYTVYDNGKTVTDKTSILANRNLSNIDATVTLKYGLITDFAALRSYPTNFYSGSSSIDTITSIDRFQETGLNVGEGLLIYHTSTDGKWFFVQARNYYGWVETKYVAQCTYEVMNNFLNSENFIIVTADKLNINDVYVRMGQRIPYLNKTETDYIINFPTKDSNGNLVLKEMKLSNSLDISDGYLEYTLENIFKQGFKMLGIPYSWGDKYVEGRDCSSTLNAIYACFGFFMPRNTSNQSKIPNYSKNVTGLTFNQLKEGYHPGSLIFSSGHVLMYLGEDISGNAYVLHNTNASIPGCKVQSLSSYGINKIIATLKIYND